VKIVMVSSEAVPFCKTGGLADVVGGLSRALDRAGHDVTIILPHYRRITPAGLEGEPTGRAVSVPLGRHAVQAWIRKAKLPDSRVEVLLIDEPGFFDRPGIYVQPGNGDYADNPERFIFLSRAALEICTAFELAPDIVHVHDWQTAVVPALLEVQYRQRPGFTRTASVLTLHNMAFQGNFPRHTYELTGLPWDLFQWNLLEFWGNFNFLKAGCVYADRITSVSPTYAREITTPAYGWGLEGVLKHRESQLVGILNGIDAEEWNPATDPALPMKYDRHTADRGKATCKRELQRALGLARDPDVPLCGMVSRMTDQKGFDLLTSVAQELLSTPAQYVFLGGGEPRIEAAIKSLAQQAPDRVAVHIGYSEALAHQIEAASDLFLMPSRFEPCGLNQMYSLRYGTVPLVHAVGGLADSVTNLTSDNLSAGKANGFVFYDYSPDAFLGTLRWGLGVYQDKEVWRQLQRNGMSLDLSWSASAARYVEVYQQARSRFRDIRGR
jgi:starch synthase